MSSDGVGLCIDGTATLRGLAPTEEQFGGLVDLLASKEIERQAPEFALLDINLGKETSFEVAERLEELGIPFVFASGYGEEFSLPDALAGAPTLSKPYTADSIRAILPARSSSSD